MDRGDVRDEYLAEARGEGGGEVANLVSVGEEDVRGGEFRD